MALCGTCGFSTTGPHGAGIILQRPHNSSVMQNRGRKVAMSHSRCFAAAFDLFSRHTRYTPVTAPHREPAILLSNSLYTRNIERVDSTCRGIFSIYVPEFVFGLAAVSQLFLLVKTILLRSCKNWRSLDEVRTC